MYIYFIVLCIIFSSVKELRKSLCVSVCPSVRHKFVLALNLNLSLIGQSQVSPRSVSGQSQASLRSVSGQSQASLGPVSGQSQASLSPVSGQTQVRLRSV